MEMVRTLDQMTAEIETMIVNYRQNITSAFEKSGYDLDLTIKVKLKGNYEKIAIHFGIPSKGGGGPRKGGARYYLTVLPVLGAVCETIFADEQIAFDFWDAFFDRRAERVGEKLITDLLTIKAATHAGIGALKREACLAAFKSWKRQNGIRKTQ